MNNDAFKLGWQVEERRYCTNKFHALIGVNDTSQNYSLQNIGTDGANLTIAVLSMNRSNLTIRLMESINKHIPHFAGEFLIGDNGSSLNEIAALKEKMERMPYRSRIVEFGKNYGVSGGRNRLFKFVETDWILSLDNDLYFIGNPLPQAQNDIAQLGCHFLTMPFLNSNDRSQCLYGGNLYVDCSAACVSIGVGSAYQYTGKADNYKNTGFLSTGLPGGSAIFNKHTFFAMDGFDENMFVGFEDTDLSIRLFQAGYKVGSCGSMLLIHDHAAPDTNVDKTYEKERFSNQKLLESARYLENKYGLTVWNKAVVDWLGQRQESLGISSSQENIGQTDRQTDRQTINVALVVDAPDWAFDHIADQLKQKLYGKFQCKKIYTSVIDNMADVFLLAEDCQIIHVFWRASLAGYWDNYAQERIKFLGMTEPEFHKKYIDGKIITTEVYDHLYLEKDNAGYVYRLFTDSNSLVTNYAVSSAKLKKIYDDLPGLRLRPETVLADGVDLELFVPSFLDRFQYPTERPIRFGWAGNSTWNWAAKDLKGVHTIIKPAIELLKKQGFNVEFITSDRDKNFTPFHEMPKFYGKIDCYLCASLYEGTPNPILEAMACGVPIITTDVGLVPELFGPLQMDYVLEERSVECLVRKIRQLLEHPEQFQALSEENLTRIQNWSWEKQVLNFSKFWNNLLQKR